MHSVNLDLLRAASARHDAAHSHHRAAHLEALGGQRRSVRAAWLRRLAAQLARVLAAGRSRRTRTDVP